MDTKKIQMKTFGEFIDELNYIEDELVKMLRNPNAYDKGSEEIENIRSILYELEGIRYDFEEKLSFYKDFSLKNMTMP